jgi:hypothetical protein
MKCRNCMGMNLRWTGEDAEAKKKRRGRSRRRSDDALTSPRGRGSERRSIRVSGGVKKRARRAVQLGSEDGHAEDQFVRATMPLLDEQIATEQGEFSLNASHSVKRQKSEEEA